MQGGNDVDADNGVDAGGNDVDIDNGADNGVDIDNGADFENDDSDVELGGNEEGDVDFEGNVRMPTATITEVVDDESTNGSMIGALTEEGVTTDDTTPTLSGTLSAPLIDGQVIAIYDGDTLLGYTTVTGGLSWSFTPDTELQAGLHTLKAQVENVDSGQTSTADSFDVIVNPTIAITNIFDDVGDITGNNNLLVRYVMLYQNVPSPRLMADYALMR